MTKSDEISWEVDEGVDGVDKKGEAMPSAAPGQAAVNPARAGSGAGWCSGVESVEVEAVVGGVLQRIRMRGIEPKDVGGYLRAQDPGAKWREDFPSKMGPRETKLAAVVVVSVASSDMGKSVDLIAKSAEGEDTKVRVGKKMVDGFLASVRGLGRVPEAEMVKLEGAMANKGQATVMLLSREHQFGVKYWSGDDGTKFMESVCVELPGVEPATASGTAAP